MASTKPTFDIFGPVTEKEIRVGYISTDRGYIQLVDLCEANKYEKNNPGTTFIYENRDKVLYLDINEINALTVDDLTPSKTASDGSCGGLQLNTPCNNKTVANFYGGGAEKTIVNLANTLKCYKHDVSIIVCRDEGVRKCELNNNIRI